MTDVPLQYDHPDNALALRYLASRARRLEKLFARLPRTSPADETSRGESTELWRDSATHPDAIEWMWEVAGATLPTGRRWYLNGTPVLIDSGTGLLMGICDGLQYYLRLPEAHRSRWARHKPSLGQDWVCGDFTEQEASEIAATAQALAQRKA